MRDRIGLGDQPEKEAFSATLSLRAEIVSALEHGLFRHWRSKHFEQMEKRGKLYV